MDIEQKLIDLICKQRDVFREEYKSIFKQLDKKHLNTEHSSTEFNYLLSEICGSSNTRQMIVAAICKVAAVTTNTSQLYINTSNAEDSLWELINNTSMTESQRNDVKSMQNRLKPIQSRQNSLAELLLGDTSAEASHKYDSDSDTSYNDSFGDQINKFLGLHVSSKEAATAETPYEDDFEDKSPDKQLPKIDIADESPYEDDFEDKSPDKQLLKIDIPDESPYGDDFEDKSPNKQLQGARLSHVADEDKSVVAKQCSHSSVDDDIMMRDADDVLAASLLTPAAVASKSSVAVSPQDTYESSLEFSKSFTPNTAAAATTTTTYMNSNNPTTTTIDATPDVEHSLDNFELAWSNHITTSTAVKPTIDTPPNNDIITTSPPAAATTTCNAQSSTSLKTAALIQRPTSATVTSVTKSQSSLRPKSAASATKPSSQMHRSKSASDYLSSGSGRIYTKSALPACARSKRPISAAPQSTPPPKPPVPVFRKPSQFVSKLKTITNKKFDLADIAEMQLEQPKTITTTKDLYHYIESKVNYIREVQPVVEQVWTDRIREALEVSIEQKEKQHADELSALKRQLESRQQNQQFTNLIATANSS